MPENSVDFWYTDQEINRFLTLKLKDGTDAHIYAGQAPLMSIEKSNMNFDSTLETALNKVFETDIPAIIPINTLQKVGGTEGAQGIHWILLVIKPKLDDPLHPNLLLIDPLGNNRADEADIVVEPKTSLFRLNEYGPRWINYFTQIVFLIQELLSKTQYKETSICVTGLVQQYDSSSCGPLLVDNAINEVCGSPRKKYFPEEIKALRRQQMSLNGRSVSEEQASPEEPPQRAESCMQIAASSHCSSSLSEQSEVSMSERRTAEASQINRVALDWRLLDRDVPTRSNEDSDIIARSSLNLVEIKKIIDFKDKMIEEDEFLEDKKQKVEQEIKELEDRKQNIENTIKVIENLISKMIGSNVNLLASSGFRDQVENLSSGLERIRKKMDEKAKQKKFEAGLLSTDDQIEEKELFIKNIEEQLSLIKEEKRKLEEKKSEEESKNKEIDEKIEKNNKKIHLEKEKTKKIIFGIILLQSLITEENLSMVFLKEPFKKSSFKSKILRKIEAQENKIIDSNLEIEKIKIELDSIEKSKVEHQEEIKSTESKIHEKDGLIKSFKESLLTLNREKERLVEKKASLKADTKIEDNPRNKGLAQAAQDGDRDRCEKFLEQGAYVDTKTRIDSDGNDDKWVAKTPIIRAVMANKIEVAQLLLEKGADVNEQDENGCTALHYAVRVGNEAQETASKMLSLLFSYGADVNLVNKEGKKPFEIDNFALEAMPMNIASRGLIPEIDHDKCFKVCDHLVVTKNPEVESDWVSLFIEQRKEKEKELGQSPFFIENNFIHLAGGCFIYVEEKLPENFLDEHKKNCIWVKAEKKLYYINKEKKYKEIKIEQTEMFDKKIPSNRAGSFPINYEDIETCGLKTIDGNKREWPDNLIENREIYLKYIECLKYIYHCIKEKKGSDDTREHVIESLIYEFARPGCTAGSYPVIDKIKSAFIVSGNIEELLFNIRERIVQKIADRSGEKHTISRFKSIAAVGFGTKAIAPGDEYKGEINDDQIIDRLIRGFKEEFKLYALTKRIIEQIEEEMKKYYNYEGRRLYKPYNGENTDNFNRVINNILGTYGEEFLIKELYDGQTPMAIDIDWEKFREAILTKLVTERYFTSDYDIIAKFKGIIFRAKNYKHAMDFFKNRPLTEDQKQYFLIKYAEKDQKSLNKLLLFFLKQRDVNAVRYLLKSGANISVLLDVREPEINKEIKEKYKKFFNTLKFTRLTGGYLVNNEDHKPSNKKEKKELCLDYCVFEEITPLMQAIESVNVELVEMLLNSRPDVNQANQHGWTALHHFARFSFLYSEDDLDKLSQLILFREGVNFLVRTKQGFLPSQVASDAQLKTLLEGIEKIASEKSEYTPEKRENKPEPLWDETSNEGSADSLKNLIQFVAEEKEKKKKAEEDLVEKRKALDNISIDLKKPKEIKMLDRHLAEIRLRAEEGAVVLSYGDQEGSIPYTQTQKLVRTLLQKVKNFNLDDQKNIPKDLDTEVGKIIEKARLGERILTKEQIDRLVKEIKQINVTLVGDFVGEIKNSPDAVSVVLWCSQGDFFILVPSEDVLSSYQYADRLVSDLSVYDLMKSCFLHMIKNKFNDVHNASPQDLFEYQSEQFKKLETIRSFSDFKKFFSFDSDPVLDLDFKVRISKSIMGRLKEIEKKRDLSRDKREYLLFEAIKLARKELNRCLREEIVGRASVVYAVQKSDSTDRIERLKIEKEKIMADIKRVEESLKKSEGKQVQDEENLALIIKEKERIDKKYQDELQKIDSALSELKQKKEGAESAISALKALERPLQEELSSAQTTREGLLKDQEELERKKAILLKEREKINEELIAARKKQVETQLDIEKLRLKIEESKKRKSEAEDNLNNTKKCLEAIKQIREKMKNNSQWLSYQERKDLREHFLHAKPETLLSSELLIHRLLQGCSLEEGLVKQFFNEIRSTLEEWFSPPVLTEAIEINDQPDQDCLVEEKKLQIRAYNVSWIEAKNLIREHIQKNLESIGFKLENNQLFMESSSKKISELPLPIRSLIHERIEVVYQRDTRLDIGWKEKEASGREAIDVINALQIDFNDVLKCYFDCIEIIASNDVYLDENIELPGISLTIWADNCIRVKPDQEVEIKTSGKEPLRFKESARDGSFYGEPGRNGDNGIEGLHGQHAGHVYLKAGDAIENRHKLNIHADGSNGMDGQKSGNGADGADGKNTDDAPRVLARYCFQQSITAFASRPGMKDNGEVDLCTVQTTGGLAGLPGPGGRAGREGLVTLEDRSGKTQQKDNKPGKQGSEGCRGNGGRPGKPGHWGLDSQSVNPGLFATRTREQGRYFDPGFEYSPENIFALFKDNFWWNEGVSINGSKDHDYSTPHPYPKEIRVEHAYYAFPDLGHDLPYISKVINDELERQRLRKENQQKTEQARKEVKQSMDKASNFKNQQQLQKILNQMHQNAASRTQAMETKIKAYESEIGAIEGEIASYSAQKIQNENIENELQQNINQSTSQETLLKSRIAEIKEQELTAHRLVCDHDSAMLEKWNRLEELRTKIKSAYAESETKKIDCSIQEELKSDFTQLYSAIKVAITLNESALKGEIGREKNQVAEKLKELHELEQNLAKIETEIMEIEKKEAWYQVQHQKQEELTAQFSENHQEQNKIGSLQAQKEFNPSGESKDEKTTGSSILAKKPIERIEFSLDGLVKLLNELDGKDGQSKKLKDLFQRFYHCCESNQPDRDEQYAKFLKGFSVVLKQNKEINKDDVIEIWSLLTWLSNAFKESKTETKENFSELIFLFNKKTEEVICDLVCRDKKLEEYKEIKEILKKTIQEKVFFQGLGLDAQIKRHACFYKKLLEMDFTDLKLVFFLENFPTVDFFKTSPSFEHLGLASDSPADHETNSRTSVEEKWVTNIFYIMQRSWGCLHENQDCSNLIDDLIKVNSQIKENILDLEIKNELLIFIKDQFLQVLQKQAVTNSKTKDGLQEKVVDLYAKIEQFFSGDSRKEDTRKSFIMILQQLNLKSDDWLSCVESMDGCKNHDSLLKNLIRVIDINQLEAEKIERYACVANKLGYGEALSIQYKAWIIKTSWALNKIRNQHSDAAKTAEEVITMLCSSSSMLSEEERLAVLKKLYNFILTNREQIPGLKKEQIENQKSILLRELGKTDGSQFFVDALSAIKDKIKEKESKALEYLKQYAFCCQNEDFNRDFDFLIRLEKELVEIKAQIFDEENLDLQEIFELLVREIEDKLFESYFALIENQFVDIEKKFSEKEKELRDVDAVLKNYESSYDSNHVERRNNKQQFIKLLLKRLISHKKKNDEIYTEDHLIDLVNQAGLEKLKEQGLFKERPDLFSATAFSDIENTAKSWSLWVDDFIEKLEKNDFDEVGLESSVTLLRQLVFNNHPDIQERLSGWIEKLTFLAEKQSLENQKKLDQFIFYLSLIDFRRQNYENVRYLVSDFENQRDNKELELFNQIKTYCAESMPDIFMHYSVLPDREKLLGEWIRKIVECLNADKKSFQETVKEIQSIFEYCKRSFEVEGVIALKEQARKFFDFAKETDKRKEATEVIKKLYLHIETKKDQAFDQNENDLSRFLLDQRETASLSREARYYLDLLCSSLADKIELSSLEKKQGSLYELHVIQQLNEAYNPRQRLSLCFRVSEAGANGFDDAVRKVIWDEFGEDSEDIESAYRKFIESLLKEEVLSEPENKKGLFLLSLFPLLSKRFFDQFKIENVLNDLMGSFEKHRQKPTVMETLYIVYSRYCKNCLEIKLIQDNVVLERFFNYLDTLFLRLNSESNKDQDRALEQMKAIKRLIEGDINEENLISSIITESKFYTRDEVSGWLLPKEKAFFDRVNNLDSFLSVIKQYAPLSWQEELKKVYFSEISEKFLSDRFDQVRVFINTHDFAALEEANLAISSSDKNDSLHQNTINDAYEFKTQLISSYAIAFSEQQVPAWLEMIDALLEKKDQGLSLVDVNKILLDIRNVDNLADVVHLIRKSAVSDLVFNVCVERVFSAIEKCVNLPETVNESDFSHLKHPMLNNEKGKKFLTLLSNALFFSCKDNVKYIDFMELKRLIKGALDVQVHQDEQMMKRLQGFPLSYWPILYKYKKIQGALSLDGENKKHLRLVEALVRLEKKSPELWEKLLLIIRDGSNFRDEANLDCIISIVSKFSSKAWKLDQGALDCMKGECFTWEEKLKQYVEAKLALHKKINQRDMPTILEIMRKDRKKMNSGLSALLYPENSKLSLEKIVENIINEKLSRKLSDQEIKDKAEQFKKLGEKLFLDEGKDRYTELIDFMVTIMIAVKKVTGHDLRNTQITALVCFIEGIGKKGRLAEIATGEGKSLITQILAIARALRGEKVDVLTSSKLLAQRDAEEAQKLFALFEIKVSNNCDPECENNDVERTKRYAENAVIYGETSAFQRDYLLTRHFGNPVRPLHGNSLIVDEVDSLFIDNAETSLHMSHSIENLSHLQELFTAIWFAVFGKENTKKNREKIESDLQGEINKETIKTPPELKNFIDRSLSTWIKNAYRAKAMSEGVEYSIEETGLEKRVIIMDLATGVEQVNSQWSDGLHQFLQLKHKLKMTDESLRAIFMSNMTFFQEYKGHINGMTGTIGSEEERKLLSESYDLDFFKLPRHRKRLFLKEEGEVAENDEKWKNLIVEDTKEKAKTQNRAVLIICEHKKAVGDIYSSLLGAGFKKEEIHIYDSALKDDFPYKDKPIPEGHVVVATNIAGRGTDLQINDGLEEKGGLHVITTYVPRNARILAQAEGRAARKGQQGSGKMIVCDARGDSISTTLLCELMEKAEKRRLRNIQTIKMPKLALEKEMFEKFVQLQDDVRKQLKLFDDPFTELQINSLKNRWAFWLHQYTKEMMNTYKEGKTKFLEAYEQFDQEVRVLLSKDSDFKLITESGELMKLAHYHTMKKDYKKAKACYDQVIEKNPNFSEFAYYYKMSCILSESSDFDRKKEALRAGKKAQKLFNESMSRLSTCNQFIEALDKNKQESGEGLETSYYHQMNINRQKIINVHFDAVRKAIGSDLNQYSFSSGTVKEDEAGKIFENLRKRFKNTLIKDYRVSKRVSVRFSEETEWELFLDEKKVDFPKTYEDKKQLIIDKFKNKVGKNPLEDRSLSPEDFCDIFSDKDENERKKEAYHLWEILLDLSLVRNVAPNFSLTDNLVFSRDDKARDRARDPKKYLKEIEKRVGEEIASLVSGLPEKDEKTLEAYRKSIVETLTNAIGQIKTLPALKLDQRGLKQVFSGEQIPPEIMEYTRRCCEGVLSLKEDLGWWNWDAFACAMLGVTQIVAGALIILYVPALARIGNVLISEGIGDICFAMQSMVSGQFSWKAYGDHKLQSLICSLTGASLGYAAKAVGLVSETLPASKIIEVTANILKEAMPAIISTGVSMAASGISEKVTAIIFDAFRSQFKSAILESSEYKKIEEALKTLMQGMYSKMGEASAARTIDQCYQSLDLNQLIAEGFSSQLKMIFEKIKSTLSQLTGVKHGAFALVDDALNIVNKCAELSSIPAAIPDMVTSTGKLIELFGKKLKEEKDRFDKEANTSGLESRKEDKMEAGKAQELAEKSLRNIADVILNQIQLYVQQAIVKKAVEFGLNRMIKPAIDNLNKITESFLLSAVEKSASSKPEISVDALVEKKEEGYFESLFNSFKRIGEAFKASEVKEKGDMKVLTPDGEVSLEDYLKSVDKGKQDDLRFLEKEGKLYLISAPETQDDPIESMPAETEFEAEKPSSNELSSNKPKRETKAVSSKQKSSKTGGLGSVNGNKNGQYQRQKPARLTQAQIDAETQRLFDYDRPLESSISPLDFISPFSLGKGIFLFSRGVWTQCSGALLKSKMLLNTIKVTLSKPSVHPLLKRVSSVQVNNPIELSRELVATINKLEPVLTRDGSTQLRTTLEDGSLFIVRRDVGKHAHPVRSQGFFKPVDHWNVEIHPTKGSKSQKINAHIFLDNTGGVMRAPYITRK